MSEEKNELLAAEEGKRQTFAENLHKQHHAHHSSRPFSDDKSIQAREAEIKKSEEARDEWVMENPGRALRQYYREREAAKKADSLEQADQHEQEFMVLSDSEKRLRLAQEDAFKAPPVTNEAQQGTVDAADMGRGSGRVDSADSSDKKE